MPMEFGLDTFADVTAAADGAPRSHAEVIREVVEQGVLADQCGVGVFGIGEHHRADFAVSAPEMVLAGIATRTTRLRLGSAVTVLSSDDPVRIYQRFSTLDALSAGRAEVTLGRGSFTESFPLFGFDLRQYEGLFEEKLDLFAALLRGGPVTWRGRLRAPLEGQTIYPPVEGRLRAWVGVGGSPESVVRAARHGLPLMLAVIGGDPLRFRPYVDLYHRACRELGREPGPVGIHSPGYVAETDALAFEAFYPCFKQSRDRIGAERGWPPMRPGDFEREAEQGSLYVGSPATVARRMAATITALGLQRFQLKYSAGPQRQAQLLRCIELYGTDVIKRVRQLLADRGAAAPVE